MTKRVGLFLVMLCMVILGVTILAGCRHTVKGVGQDVGAVGNEIEKSSGK